MTVVPRVVVVGRNSKVWGELFADPRLARVVAIGHAEVARFAFMPSDRVWIFSYSRSLPDNERLFSELAAAGARHAIYVTTATTNVSAVTSCYEYPRVKRACEQLSRSLLGATVVTIGVVYRKLEDLPGGTTMATHLDDLAAAISGLMKASSDSLNLFKPVERPLASPVERLAFSLYGQLQWLAGSLPCLLRPIDIMLRGLGWRWYGYLYLSNRLWLTTTS